jgi:hypothetical protein
LTRSTVHRPPRHLFFAVLELQGLVHFNDFLKGQFSIPWYGVGAFKGGGCRDFGVVVDIRCKIAAMARKET